MNKKYLLYLSITLVFVFLLISHVQAVKQAASQTSTVKQIILFSEPGKKSFGWDITGDISPTFITTEAIKGTNSKILNELSGYYSLNVTGQTSNWYVGGTYSIFIKSWTTQEVNFGQYNAFQIYLYGYGPNSGTISVQLIDDDKGKGQIKRDSQGSPIANDVFKYDIPINWDGWKKVTIPFRDFKLQNPGRGNGILNMSKSKGKGGLIELDLFFLASKKEGTINCIIDNISFVKINLPVKSLKK